MIGSRVERFARQLPQARTDSVRHASATKVQQRLDAMHSSFSGRAEDARAYAAQVKSYVLDNLKDLLTQLEARCQENGIKVHWAGDAQSAREIVLGIVRDNCAPGGTIVKGKSMVTEEIHLNHALEAAGYRPVETDLGEFVVQVDGDTPSHIVTPIIHKNRYEVARSFERIGLGPYTDKPEELTLQARTYLRERFKEAQVGISGVNFAIASSGRLVIVENEGNNRLSTTAPKVHIAVTGIEKLLPSDYDLPVFLKLLAGSATGQRVTTYVNLISGPSAPDVADGPSEVHLVFVDNGRSKVLNGPYRDILRCIRCGACLNVCPVYRQASGHAYGHVYGGPIGAVFAPAIEGVHAMGDVAKASSLCGSCEEVCPVKIPIPHMLLHLRDEGKRFGALKDPIPWKWFGFAAADIRKWRAGIALLPLVSGIPNPALGAWTEFKDAPRRTGREFRRWWLERS